MLDTLTPGLIIGIIALYFMVLIAVSFWTGKGTDNSSFFLAGRNSPWYLVAFGMIGASLSGVTFISVPGWVESNQFSYMQMVLGYLLGYFIIATVLLPMYYRLNLTSVYTYLEKRFGVASYKTGAAFFLLSRTIGASFRLYLVAIVLQQFVMEPYGIPFWATVLMTILLIWIYTFRGGIKTIVWTDTLQTACMLVAVIFTVFSISQRLDFSFGDMVGAVSESAYSQIFFFDGGWADPKNFFKQFLAGASIAVVMTGLDQDMMQKNLSCRTLFDAQKNMFWFSIVLVFANLLFLTLGALLFIYAGEVGIDIPTKIVNGTVTNNTDLLYPTIALEHLSPTVGIFFILGLIAAAYSSADSALTALTTSFCIDFLGFEKDKNTTIDKSDLGLANGDLIDEINYSKEDGNTQRTSEEQKQTRTLVHIGFSFLLFAVIMIFWLINDSTVISWIFKIAGYTYGPLLGLYTFGFFSKRKIIDIYTPYICAAAPIITYFLNKYSETLFFGYKFGFELLLLNGLITFIGLLAISYHDLDKEKD